MSEETVVYAAEKQAKAGLKEAVEQFRQLVEKMDAPKIKLEPTRWRYDGGILGYYEIERDEDGAGIYSISQSEASFGSYEEAVEEVERMIAETLGNLARDLSSIIETQKETKQ